MYEAPKLVRLGHIAALTASDIKCSAGGDLGYGTRWRHPTQPPFTTWTNGTQTATAAELLRSGDCKWASQ